MYLTKIVLAQKLKILYIISEKSNLSIFLRRGTWHVCLKALSLSYLVLLVANRENSLKVRGQVIKQRESFSVNTQSKFGY